MRERFTQDVGRQMKGFKMKYAKFSYKNESFVIVFKNKLSRVLSGKESISPLKAKRLLKSGSEKITA